MMGLFPVVTGRATNFKYHIQFINTALMRYERFFGTVFCSLSDPAHASARVCIA